MGNDVRERYLWGDNGSISLYRTNGTFFVYLRLTPYAKAVEVTEEEFSTRGKALKFFNAKSKEHKLNLKGG